MSPENFCYWLQGLLELQPDLKALDGAQVQMVRDHLGYVCTHVQEKKQPAQTQAAQSDYLRQYQSLLGIAQGAEAAKTLAIC